MPTPLARKDKKPHVHVLEPSSPRGDFLALSPQALVERPYLVLVQRPSCPYCVALSPQWAQFVDHAPANLGIVTVNSAALGAPQAAASPVCRALGDRVSGVPHLSLFLPGSQEPVDFEGERTTGALLDFVVGELAKLDAAASAAESAAAAAAAGSGRRVMRMM